MWAALLQLVKTSGVVFVGAISVLLLIGLFATPNESINSDQEAATSSDSVSKEAVRSEVTSETVIDEPMITSEPQIPQVPQVPIAQSMPPPVDPQPTPAQPKIPPRYDTPPLLFDVVTKQVLPSLVNILCIGRSSTIGGATGSGIIIDQRGVILTNAHVAQYFLLQEHLREGVLNCTIRTGAPAKERYLAELLFMPKQWAEKHAGDILKEKPTSTGEHDWALLRIVGRTDGSPVPKTFPFLSFDAREHIARKGDSVLLSSYPAGVLGGITIRKNLWPASTVANIEDIFTFETGLVDILSFGGTIVAQSGSSGGAVVNQWGQLVGIVVTSTQGDTTSDRDLRAVTISHIERSVSAHLNIDLAGFLNESLDVLINNFRENMQPSIWEYFSNVLPGL